MFLIWVVNNRVALSQRKSIYGPSDNNTAAELLLRYIAGSITFLRTNTSPSSLSFWQWQKIIVCFFILPISLPLRTISPSHVLFLQIILPSSFTVLSNPSASANYHREKGEVMACTAYHCRVPIFITPLIWPSWTVDKRTTLQHHLSPLLSAACIPVPRLMCPCVTLLLLSPLAIKVKVNNPITGLDRPWGFQQAEALRF
jgi:hypothetical protein